MQQIFQKLFNLIFNFISGVNVIILGIGAHLNPEELIQIAGTPNAVFQNLSDSESISAFATHIRKLAVGEKCEFSRGGEGAEIKCESDSITVSVTTRNRFRGHFYVKDALREKGCEWRNENETKAAEEFNKGGGDELNLRIGLNKCGLERQFSVSCLK